MVDVAAPGCNYTTWPGDSYGDSCGTSSAAPLVAGLAGLLLSHEPAASVAALEAAITTTAHDIGTVVAYGRVDAHAAVLAVGDLVHPLPGEGGDDPGEEPEAPNDPIPGDSLSFRGTLNNKHMSRQHLVAVPDGTVDATLEFARADELTLRVLTVAGVDVAATTGPSIITRSATVSTGEYLLDVSGDRSSYTLTIVWHG